MLKDDDVGLGGKETPGGPHCGGEWRLGALELSYSLRCKIYFLFLF